MEPRFGRDQPPFLGSDAVAEGATTWDRLARGDFVQLAVNVYAGADTANDVARRVRTLHRWGREAGVIGGPLAALAQGVDCAWDDAELILPTPRTRPPAGARVRTAVLADGEVTECSGVPVTTPLRTAFDLARRSPLVDAVASIDALARHGGFGAAELRAIAEAHPGTRGLVQLRRVADLMNPLAESLMETRTRLVLVMRGVPAPVLQHPVVLGSGRRARLDLAWPENPAGRPLAVEYDGGSHRTVEGQNADRERDGALDELGWDVIHVGSRQVYRDADALAARVLRHLGIP